MASPEALSIVLFPTTQVALRAEQLLLAAGLPVKLIPVPRRFGSDCGLGLRFASREAERLRQVLEEGGVCYRGIHEL